MTATYGGRRHASADGNAESSGRSGRSGRSEDDGGAAPGGRAGHRASLVERGYVHARFGGVPVFVGPELAAQIKAIRQKQP